MNNKYSQKPLDSANTSTRGAIKTASKKAIQNTAEATGDLIGNKIADKITSTSKSPQNDEKLHSKTDENEIEILKERYISPEKKRQQIIDELRLV